MGWGFRQKEELDKRELENRYRADWKAGTSGQGLNGMDIGNWNPKRIKDWRNGIG